MRRRTVREKDDDIENSPSDEDDDMGDKQCDKEIILELVNSDSDSDDEDENNSKKSDTALIFRMMEPEIKTMKMLQRKKDNLWRQQQKK